MSIFFITSIKCYSLNINNFFITPPPASALQTWPRLLIWTICAGFAPAAVCADVWGNNLEKFLTVWAAFGVMYWPFMLITHGFLSWITSSVSPPAPARTPLTDGRVLNAVTISNQTKNNH